eukprot:CAMPEP_0178985648 /NCGR_PEP_ID=MMETSP0795-20121207/2266_1 /TAXON_ID=88552 /ORGANISM="Amoebophrya sp., Strain Ameob2" /LENGTH=1422 /DNA_ID=CAMNT_0020676623 /DNA_START=88 /DNA_END=4359 /DNA_ORIENTATION=-
MTFGGSEPSTPGGRAGTAFKKTPGSNLGSSAAKYAPQSGAFGSVLGSSQGSGSPIVSGQFGASGSPGSSAAGSGVNSFAAGQTPSSGSTGASAGRLGTAFGTKKATGFSLLGDAGAGPLAPSGSASGPRGAAGGARSTPASGAGTGSMLKAGGNAFLNVREKALLFSDDKPPDEADYRSVDNSQRRDQFGKLVPKRVVQAAPAGAPPPANQPREMPVLSAMQPSSIRDSAAQRSPGSGSTLAARTKKDGTSATGPAPSKGSDIFGSHVYISREMQLVEETMHFVQRAASSKIDQAAIDAYVAYLAVMVRSGKLLKIVVRWRKVRVLIKMMQLAESAERELANEEDIDNGILDKEIAKQFDLDHCLYLAAERVFWEGEQDRGVSSSQQKIVSGSGIGSSATAFYPYEGDSPSSSSSSSSCSSRVRESGSSGSSSSDGDDSGSGSSSSSGSWSRSSSCWSSSASERDGSPPPPPPPPPQPGSSEKGCRTDHDRVEARVVAPDEQQDSVLPFVFYPESQEPVSFSTRPGSNFGRKRQAGLRTGGPFYKPPTGVATTVPGNTFASLKQSYSPPYKPPSSESSKYNKARTMNTGIAIHSSHNWETLLTVLKFMAILLPNSALMRTSTLDELADLPPDHGAYWSAPSLQLLNAEESAALGRNVWFQRLTAIVDNKQTSEDSAPTADELNQLSIARDQMLRVEKELQVLNLICKMRQGDDGAFHRLGELPLSEPRHLNSSEIMGAILQPGTQVGDGAEQRVQEAAARDRQAQKGASAEAKAFMQEKQGELEKAQELRAQKQDAEKRTKVGLLPIPVQNKQRNAITRTGGSALSTVNAGRLRTYLHCVNQTIMKAKRRQHAGAGNAGGILTQEDVDAMHYLDSLGHSIDPGHAISMHKDHLDPQSHSEYRQGVTDNRWRKFCNFADFVGRAHVGLKSHHDGAFDGNVNNALSPSRLSSIHAQHTASTMNKAGMFPLAEKHSPSKKLLSGARDSHVAAKVPSASAKREPGLNNLTRTRPNSSVPASGPGSSTTGRKSSKQEEEEEEGGGFFGWVGNLFSPRGDDNDKAKEEEERRRAEQEQAELPKKKDKGFWGNLFGGDSDDEEEKPASASPSSMQPSSSMHRQPSIKSEAPPKSEKDADEGLGFFGTIANWFGGGGDDKEKSMRSDYSAAGRTGPASQQLISGASRAGEPDPKLPFDEIENLRRLPPRKPPNHPKFKDAEYWWEGPMEDEEDPWEYMRQMCAVQWLAHHTHEEEELFNPGEDVDKVTYRVATHGESKGADPFAALLGGGAPPVSVGSGAALPPRSPAPKIISSGPIPPKRPSSMSPQQPSVHSTRPVSSDDDWGPQDTAGGGGGWLTELGHEHDVPDDEVFRGEAKIAKDFHDENSDAPGLGLDDFLGGSLGPMPSMSMAPPAKGKGKKGPAFGKGKKM